MDIDFCEVVGVEQTVFTEVIDRPLQASRRWLMCMWVFFYTFLKKLYPCYRHKHDFKASDKKANSKRPVGKIARVEIEILVYSFLLHSLSYRKG